MLPYESKRVSFRIGLHQEEKMLKRAKKNKRGFSAEMREACDNHLGLQNATESYQELPKTTKKPRGPYKRRQ